MAGRFSTRRAGPEFPPVPPALPVEALAPVAPAAVPPPVPPPPTDAITWTVFPQAEPEPEPIVPLLLAPQPAPVAAQPSASSANPLLTDKLLDAKVRLHRKLIEEINLSALEKLPEDEMRSHIQQLVTQYILVE